jgi:alpha-beta hydrolase superfamily lysophospholipase
MDFRQGKRMVDPKDRRGPRWRIAALAMGAVTLILIVVFLMGPRTRVSVDIGSADFRLPGIGALDAYLARGEGAIADLIPGTEKKIRWARGAGVRTKVALVYIHGFSASRQESWPLMDEVAAALDANLFYTRLRGHGRDGEALAAATVEDWQRDGLEALAIGRELGERLVLVGASNGGTLATWLATQPAAADLAALILLSPNDGPRDPMSELLLWPWADLLVRAIIGPEYQFTPQNPEHARYWTWQYPSHALLTMMGVVKLARQSQVESIQSPLLVLYAPDDQVVNPERIRHFFSRFGSRDKQLVALTNTSDRQHHALAGNILAPADTPRVRTAMVDFLKRRLQLEADAGEGSSAHDAASKN